MDELNGILCRGVLLGYGQVPDNYKDKSGSMVMRQAHLLGVERDSVGRFGEKRKTTIQLHIPDDLVKNQNFMNSVSAFIGHVVEVPLSGYSDFSKRLFLSNDSRIFSLTSTSLAK
jgi:hypothetical protein